MSKKDEHGGHSEGKRPWWLVPAITGLAQGITRVVLNLLLDWFDSDGPS